MSRPLERVLPAGLRWRLTAWVAGVMLVSIAAIFAVVYRDTGSQVRSEIERNLARDTAGLAAVVRAQHEGPPERAAGALSRYLRAQPFTATSTLLFALIGGQLTASNHPEVFKSAQAEGGEKTVEQARENVWIQQLKLVHAGYFTAAVPDAGRMRIHERQLTVGRERVIVAAGQPLAEVERAQHGVAGAFVLAGALTLALALLASYLAGARVSAPLRRMASVAARVDAGDLAPRMGRARREANEVRVLAEAFDHMLERLQQAFASQREFVADASHELRTPLAVIQGQLEVLAAERSPDRAEIERVTRVVRSEIERLTRLVDDLLLLARSEEAELLRREPVELEPYLTELWQRITSTAQRRFELGPVPRGTLQADPHHLAQALGNLLRNAIEHTAEGNGRVSLAVSRLGSDRIRFVVSDDGPGIPPTERERVFERFHRTDPARARSAGGAGLGLAIVRAVAEAHGGHVAVTDPPHGRGARIDLVLPGFRPG